MWLFFLEMGSKQTCVKTKYETLKLKRYRLDQRQLSLKMQGYCILIHEYLLPNQALYLQVLLQIEQNWFFFVLKAPTENDIYELFITKWTSITVYPRTPEVDGGVSQFDVGVPYHKLRYLKRMFKGCIRMSDVIPLLILIYYENCN